MIAYREITPANSFEPARERIVYETEAEFLARLAPRLEHARQAHTFYGDEPSPEDEVCNAAAR
jgi:hypothetical protein